nr:NADH dehydrogenase subunit 1 [Peloridium hammoniorum]
MYYVCFLTLSVMVLLSLAFFTLFERSILSYVQIRSGPNKNSIMGILQPFSDALKLFSKDFVYLTTANYLIYMLTPFFGLFFSLIMWLIYPFFFHINTFTFGMLYFICVSSMGVYIFMLSAWAANSSYGMLGGLRAIAQSISYEASLIIILMSLMFLINGFNLCNLYYYQKGIWFGFLLFPLMLMLFSSFLAETNRSPFDFAEGESELVSGFNIEFGGGSFSFLFLSEYSNIMFMSLMINVLFMGSSTGSYFFYINMVFIMFCFIWIRGTFPRYRYDKLMNLSWTIYLPISLNILILCINMTYLMSIFIYMSKVNKSI